MRNRSSPCNNASVRVPADCETAGLPADSWDGCCGLFKSIPGLLEPRFPCTSGTLSGIYSMLRLGAFRSGSLKTCGNAAIGQMPRARPRKRHLPETSDGQLVRVAIGRYANVN